MDCEHALTLISARLDREITPGENAWLNEHLHDCGACRVTAEAFALQHDELRQTFEPRRAAVVATEDRVYAALREQRRGARRWWQGLLRPGVLIPAAVVLWAVLAVVLYSTRVLHRDQAMIASSNLHPLAIPLPALATSNEGLKPRELPKVVEPPPLKPGDQIKTALGERRRAKLPDGSKVFLNENTAMTCDNAASVTLQNGTAYFELTPSGNNPPPSSRLVVLTSDRLVLPQGSKFAVQKDKQGTSLLAVEGEIVAGPPADGVLPLTNGALSVLHTGEMLAPQSNVVSASPRLSHVLDWTRDLMSADEPALVPASSYDGGALIAVDANGQEAKLSLRKYHVDVHLEDGFARTTIDQTYFNHHPWRLEGTFYFPLPPDASLSRLAMYVDGQLNEGGMVERDYGRTVYDRVVNGQRDPALLEWVDGSTFKMRVFPLEGRQEKRLILSYTQRVPTLYGRAQYRFPAGHNLQTVRDWSFHALVKNGDHWLAASPTHPGMKKTVQGGDLVLTDAAEDCKVDRDVVLELTDPSFVAAEKDAVRFSCAEQDGNEYLMMRYRPQLPAQKKRERRDWIFLYESSADRDPLLARTQIEIIRGLLQNAERDDQFRLLVVSNRVRNFVSGIPPAADCPYPASVDPNTITEAIKFLEQSHLVGALDLGEAFRAIEKCTQGSENLFLVHVGSGYTGMGTPQDELPKLLSPHTHYIGVGVGKRWNRAFMKQCAEKTGGYVTQINPDESISWRTFDLMATLNTPRLLDIKVVDSRSQKEAKAARWLLDSNVIAQGEELCALTRLGERKASDEVTITGLLDGEPFERNVRIEKVAQNAAYIPRTWAKLEIDRLLTDDPRKHKNAIIELSKAMYVMTPFTSLLVLENEAMYKEFKVDRGRKDHWAMYSCPERIPIVYEPDPTMPTDVRNAPKGLKPAVHDVLHTMCVRVPRTWTRTADSGRDGETTFLEGDWIHGRGGYATTDLSLRLGDLMDWKKELQSQVKGNTPDIQGQIFSPEEEKAIRFKEEVRELGLRRLGRNALDAAGDADFFSSSGRILAAGKINQIRLWGETAPNRPTSSSFAEADPLPDAPALPPPSDWTLGLPLRPAPRDTRVKHDPSVLFFDALNLNSAGEFGLDVKTLPGGRVFSELQLESHLNAGLLDLTPEVRGDNRVSRLGRLQTAKPLLYQHPSYSHDARLFTDLLSYAPGLNTSEADVLAVLEAEAMPDLRQAPGSIDPAARKLIDATRKPIWRQLTLPGTGKQPEQVIRFDATGRYSYERTPPLGLREMVVCDGTTLLHQYPEIGLAGRRTVTRFHRAALTSLLPWLLPPAEDLAHGVDLQCVDASTVALVPHWIRDARASKNETPLHTQLHLHFAKDRLAERRLIEMPANKTLARECYDGAGGVRWLDGNGKEIDKTTLKISDATAPDMRPDLANLVVLLLPYRSRAHVMTELSLNPSQPLAAEENGCFEDLKPEEGLKLLATLVAEHNADEAQLLYRRCFFANGDTRRGLFTLLSAAGVAVNREPGLQQAFADNPNDELLQYLALCGSSLYQYAQRWLPLHRGHTAGPDTNLLRELSDAQALLFRFSSPTGRRLYWEERQDDMNRASAFLRRHAHDELGRALLLEMQNRLEGRSALSEERLYRTLAEEWRRLADANDGAYRPRYEEAYCLCQGGQRGEAEKIFEDLYAQALKAGVLPPIDRRFKEGLQNLEEKPFVDNWNPRMRETARQFIAKQQYAAVIALAWQCQQIDSRALADTLLDEVLTAAKNQPDGGRTTLAVADFYAKTNEPTRAEALLQPLLADEKWAREPNLWRKAAQLAQRRGLETKAVGCLEKALDLEYEHLPEVIELRAWREDYSRLLDHYHKLAESAKALSAAAPADLVTRTLRAIDRWRAHDPETAEACKKAAEVFALLGNEDLAWDYQTTALLGNGLEVSPWQSLAESLHQQGSFHLADRALLVAAAVDPSNAEVVWRRANNLRQLHQNAEADKLMGRLATEQWPARYQGIRSQAQYYLKSR